VGTLTGRGAFPLNGLRFRNRLVAVVYVAVRETPDADDEHQPRRGALTSAAA
jgi:hypothetical protein